MWLAELIRYSIIYIPSVNKQTNNPADLALNKCSTSRKIAHATRTAPVSLNTPEQIDPERNRESGARKRAVSLSFSFFLFLN